MLRLPDLGETLSRIAAEGADVLYRGDLARETAATVAAGGGELTATISRPTASSGVGPSVSRTSGTR